MKKNNDSVVGGKSAARKSIPVDFSHPVSVAIAIGSTFNDRKRDAIRMKAISESRWRREWVLSPGLHE